MHYSGAVKSRPLHAKGLEQVLKWLHEIKGHYRNVKAEAGPLPIFINITYLMVSYLCGL